MIPVSIVLTINPQPEPCLEVHKLQQLQIHRGQLVEGHVQPVQVLHGRRQRRLQCWQQSSPKLTNSVCLEVGVAQNWGSKNVTLANGQVD